MLNESVPGDLAWRKRLNDILQRGTAVSPRGMQTLELLHPEPLLIDLSKPVVTTRSRKLNYRFMAAEALWILSGDNKLAPLQRFIKSYDRFSDDGETLTGAYGPMVVPQLDYVLRALLNDRDTRQAVLTIWRPNPAPSRDIPCTIAMNFSIRDNKLYQHVFMRSSDAWLGVPYDMFSFSMVGVYVACRYNSLCNPGDYVDLGHLAISMTSSHLYEQHWGAAQLLLATEADCYTPQRVPAVAVQCGCWAELERDLISTREGFTVHAWQVKPR